VWISASRIEGSLILHGSHWHQLLSLRGSTITADLLGDRLSAESIILINYHAAVEGEVNLRGAKIGGHLALDQVVVGGAVDLNAVDITGTLFMTGAGFGGEINLVGAKIGSDLAMINSTFSGPVDADGLTVGGNLFMNDATFKGEMVLRVTIGGIL